MPCEIQPDAIRCARAWYPNCDVSGVGGPWGVVRFNYGGRPAIVMFPSLLEASTFGAKTGDRLIEFKTPVPKKVRDIGYRDRDDDERWERRMGVDGL
jgi:hypothetical protein